MVATDPESTPSEVIGPSEAACTAQVQSQVNRIRPSLALLLRGC